MVTRRPRHFNSRPSDEAVSPFPSEEDTPPVTKMYLVSRGDPPSGVGPPPAWSPDGLGEVGVSGTLRHYRNHSRRPVDHCGGRGSVGRGATRSLALEQFPGVSPSGVTVRAPRQHATQLDDPFVGIELGR